MYGQRLSARKSFLLLAVSFIFIFPNMPAAKSENVGPFGLDVGKDTFEILKKAFDESNCDYSQNSAITSGKLVVCPSRSFDFDGITDDVIFIFSKDNKLDAVLLTISKNNFESILSSLSSKYKVIEKHQQFVGDAYAKLRGGNINIFLQAPHLSFEMSLIYSTDDFDKKCSKRQKQKIEDKKRKQNSNL